MSFTNSDLTKKKSLLLKSTETSTKEVSIESDLDASEGKNEVVILSVEQLNRKLKSVIESQMGLIWVQGEISNFVAHSSGHFYFSIKDDKAQMRAVMFRGHNSRLKFKPANGLEVILRGRVTMYEPRGENQIVCEMMEPVGAGALQKAFEQLKEKLKAEGLFDSAKKRKLPEFPKHIIIVTSPTGAAIQDMINILTRRNRTAAVTLIPTVVQGEAAAPKIIEALSLAYRIADADVIIVGRGGGSIEDLWAFNNEELARVIARSPVPIISAVGHEIDFTIGDFVADLRAPTPSAAAELVVKNVQDLESKIKSTDRLLVSTFQKLYHRKKESWFHLSKRLIDPKRKMQDLIVRNDELFERLFRANSHLIQNKKLEVELLLGRLPKPQSIIEEFKSRIELLKVTMDSSFQKQLEYLKSRFHNNVSLLDSLSPLRVLDRGYSITTRNEKIVKSLKGLKESDLIDVQVSDGHIKAEIKELKWTSKKS